MSDDLGICGFARHERELLRGDAAEAERERAALAAGWGV
jgi:hypothetical protein